MAACPTCFTKVDITAAAVRAATYASATRDRYERKYRRIKCDVAEAVCATSPLLPLSKTLSVPQGPVLQISCSTSCRTWSLA